MDEIQKGDVVTLKSGGPKMTVASRGDYESGGGLGPKDGVVCVWFETIKGVQQPQQKVFDAVVLEKAKPFSMSVGRG